MCPKRYSSRFVIWRLDRETMVGVTDCRSGSTAICRWMRLFGRSEPSVAGIAVEPLLQYVAAVSRSWAREPAPSPQPPQGEGAARSARVLAAKPRRHLVLAALFSCVESS